MPESSYRHLPVEMIVQETDKAFLITSDLIEGTYWIPKSQIADVEDYKKGDVNVTISVTEWFIDKEQLQDLCEN